MYVIVVNKTVQRAFSVRRTIQSILIDYYHRLSLWLRDASGSVSLFVDATS
jgi:hypothetical protein